MRQYWTFPKKPVKIDLYRLNFRALAAGQWLKYFEVSNLLTATKVRLFKGKTMTVLMLILIGLASIIALEYLRRRYAGQIEKSFQREEIYRQILESVPDMVLVKGPESKILWANKAFRDFYGMSLASLQNIIDAPFSPPDHTAAYIRDDFYVFSTGKVLEIPQENVARHDGTVRLFNTIKFPLFDKHKNVTMTAGLSRDITDRIDQANKIREQQAVIANASKLSALGEMAANLAHEINNPLAIIDARAGFLERSLNESGALPMPKSLEHVKSIRATVQRMVKIIHSLNILSRDGSMDGCTNLYVADLMEHVYAVCSEKFRLAGTSILIDDETLQLSLTGREVGLSQVFLNLISNAFDAVKNEELREIVVKGGYDGDMVKISIQDSGPGIPADIRKELFKQFFTTKPPGFGTGLGLSIARKIAQQHGGDLYLDENASKTTFVLTLAKVQDSAPALQKLG